MKKDEIYVMLDPRIAAAAKKQFKPLPKLSKSRDELIAKGICIACQLEKSSEHSPLGKQCLYKFSAIEAKMMRVSV